MYELSNHLGNVLTTVSDIKLTADGNTDGVVDSYAAVIASAQDYYPFGSLETDRTYSSDNYRFGFNGKENDNEVKGTGNSVDFGARIYDSRLGRFLSVDPEIYEYPFMSSYCYAANNPIFFIDIDGEGPIKPPAWTSKGVIKLINSSKVATKMFNSLGSAWTIVRVSTFESVGYGGQISATDDGKKTIGLYTGLNDEEAFRALVFEMQNALQSEDFRNVESAAESGIYEKWSKDDGSIQSAAELYAMQKADIEIRSLMTTNQVLLEVGMKTEFSTQKANKLIAKFTNKYGDMAIGDVYAKGADYAGFYNNSSDIKRGAFRLAKRVYKLYKKETSSRYTELGSAYYNNFYSYQKQYNKLYKKN